MNFYWGIHDSESYHKEKLEKGLAQERQNPIKYYGTHDSTKYFINV